MRRVKRSGEKLEPPATKLCNTWTGVPIGPLYPRIFKNAPSFNTPSYSFPTTQLQLLKSSPHVWFLRMEFRAEKELNLLTRTEVTE